MGAHEKTPQGGTLRGLTTFGFSRLARPQHGVLRRVSFVTKRHGQPKRRRDSNRKLADHLLDQRLNAALKADANDNLYQWDSSRDYDPSGELEKIPLSPRASSCHLVFL